MKPSLMASSRSNSPGFIQAPHPSRLKEIHEPSGFDRQISAAFSLMLTLHQTGMANTGRSQRAELSLYLPTYSPVLTNDYWLCQVTRFSKIKKLAFKGVWALPVRLGDDYFRSC